MGVSVWMVLAKLGVCILRFNDFLDFCVRGWRFWGSGRLVFDLCAIGGGGGERCH